MGTSYFTQALPKIQCWMNKIVTWHLIFTWFNYVSTYKVCLDLENSISVNVLNVVVSGLNFYVRIWKWFQSKLSNTFIVLLATQFFLVPKELLLWQIQIRFSKPKKRHSEYPWYFFRFKSWNHCIINEHIPF